MSTNLLIVGTGKGAQSHYAHEGDEVTFCGRGPLAWARPQSDEPGSYYREATCFRCLKARA